MIKMKVIAKKGVLVPFEDKANAYIDDQIAVEVPKNAYYMRRINDGDLAQVKASASPVTQVDLDKPKKGIK